MIKSVNILLAMWITVLFIQFSIQESHALLYNWYGNSGGVEGYIDSQDGGMTGTLNWTVHASNNQNYSIITSLTNNYYLWEQYGNPVNKAEYFSFDFDQFFAPNFSLYGCDAFQVSYVWTNEPSSYTPLINVNINTQLRVDVLNNGYFEYIGEENHIGSDSGYFYAEPVPEPSTFLLFGAGLSGFVFWRRRNKK